MSITRICSICGLALVLALVGTGWAQTSKTSLSDHADHYRQAVSFLDQAQQKLNAGDVSAAKSMAKEANSLFTLLQKECASELADRQINPKEEQQLAINQKFATDHIAQADRLMEQAAANKQKGRKLASQGQEGQSQKYYRQAKDENEQAQQLFIRAQIFALRNQQLIFSFLAP
jgi:hypothetical protein